MKRLFACAMPIVAACACMMSLARASGNDAGIGKITAYQGTWTSHIVYHATKYSKPRLDTDTVRNDCWRSAGFYACDQFVNGPSMALVVFTYDAAHDVYHTSAIPKDGSAAGSAGVLQIHGNTWTYPWQNKDGGKTVYVRILNIFSDPNTIEFHEEYSLDNRHWTHIADGHEHRTV